MCLLDVLLIGVLGAPVTDNPAKPGSDEEIRGGHGETERWEVVVSSRVSNCLTPRCVCVESSSGVAACLCRPSRPVLRTYECDPIH